MKPVLGRIIIYAKDLRKMALFYEKFFGFECHTFEGDRICELTLPSGGMSIMLHPAGKGIKTGQAGIKLVFDIKDVEQFRNQSAKEGLKFGALHQADGYEYSNAKDPEKNSIQISSRIFRS
jgi:predicted enzyme related to lactoylglutathione lyase